MKKVLNVFNLTFIFSLLMLMTFALFAQTPTPVPTPIPPPAPSVGEVLMAALEIVKNWKTLGIFGGIAAALKLLIDAFKAFKIFDKIPAAFQSPFVLLVSVVTVGLGSAAGGASGPEAVGAAVASAGMAMLLHELTDDLLGLLKKKLPAPPPK